MRGFGQGAGQAMAGFAGARGRVGLSHCFRAQNEKAAPDRGAALISDARESLTLTGLWIETARRLRFDGITVTARAFCERKRRQSHDASFLKASRSELANPSWSF